MIMLMITLIAIIGGVIETLILYKNSKFGDKILCVIRTAWLIETFSMIAIRINRLTKHFLYLEEYDTRKYIAAAVTSLIACALTLAIVTFIAKHNTYNEKEEKHKTLVRAAKIIGLIIFTIGLSLLTGSMFVFHEWNSVDPEQLMYNTLAPTVGTELGIYMKGFEYVFITFGIVGAFGIFMFKKFKLVLNFKKKSVTVINHSIKALMAIILSVVTAGGAVYYAQIKLDAAAIFEAYFVNSDFIEENYVDARDVEISFPEQKRNIIYIYLESIENTYLSRELGGYMDSNLMPELTELSYEGVTFSNTETKFGGPLQITGTSWSLASMVNQNLGITLKAPHSFTAFSTPGHYLSGVYGFGDILADNGYQQTVMIGADARFGGLNYLYQTHGDYKIFDYEFAKTNHYIPEDYHVWWGYEDDKLYEFAEQEITALYESGKPFNFTMENADTHMPDGYLPEGAPAPYDSPYANAIANSTCEVVKFVRWIQEQPFYENTTVILIGDHLSMDVKFFADMDPTYLRTQYNLILNPADNVKSTDPGRYVNREYANFDMLPTVLSAMGCQIEGDKLGLGTNLFSDRKTLLEEYSTEFVDSELEKASRFYNNEFVK